MNEIVIDGESLTIQDMVHVARENFKVRIADKVKKKVKESRRVIEKIIEQRKVAYGINTGFGKLCTKTIPKKQIEKLQVNLIHSHATGVGQLLPEDVVRATILLRANSLAKGYSGIRLQIVEMLLEMLNKGVHPVIPEKGSLGASGDLAPLAHMSLVIIGEGKVRYKGKILEVKDALKSAGIKPLKLQSKEGLALINGTSLMTAIAALAIYDSERLIKTAEIAGATSLEPLMGTDISFNERVMAVRPHKGQTISAENLRLLTRGSEIIESHKACMRVQDAYSLRCMPQVFGAIRDAVEYAKRIVSVEMNSATDNPLIFSNMEESISCGNFHGDPIALPMDLLSIAITKLGVISERRIERLLNPNLSGMPPFLTNESGLSSGFMIAQYTAASLVSENRTLAHPASVDSIPVSASQEDYVSMATISARNTTSIIRNAEYIVSIELLCAAQALEFRKPLNPGIGVKAAYNLIRKYIPKLEEDRPMYDDIEKAVELVRSGEVLRVVEEKVGMLN